jgi:hypothetical protein
MRPVELSNSEIDTAIASLKSRNLSITPYRVIKITKRGGHQRVKDYIEANHEPSLPIMVNDPLIKMLVDRITPIAKELQNDATKSIANSQLLHHEEIINLKSKLDVTNELNNTKDRLIREKDDKIALLESKLIELTQF